MHSLQYNCAIIFWLPFGLEPVISEAEPPIRHTYATQKPVKSLAEFQEFVTPQTQGACYVVLTKQQLF